MPDLDPAEAPGPSEAAGSSPEPPTPPSPPPPSGPSAGPPSGPPSGPPTGPPPGPPTGPPPAPRAAAPVTPSEGLAPETRRLLAIVGAVLAGVAAIAVAVFALGGGDEQASKKDREVLLEATASAGPAPFTPDLQPVSATALTTSTTSVPAAATTVPAPSGRTAAGPFGGTGDNTLCDRELLVEFLTDPSNAAVAREWARVLDVRVEDIPTYVRALIPTTLTSDTRVTNHRFENGRAVGYQAVLKRGTAVLVDTKGRLIARCRCGNPLLPPQEIARPVYTGPRWEGFNPTVIVVVVPSPSPIYPPGGVGTLPPTSTTRPTTTTTSGDRSQQAIDRIRIDFEACLRGAASNPGSFFTPEEIEQIIASLRYSAIPTGAPNVYRVVITAGSESASWDVDVRTGEVTPLDANAQETASECPTLA